MDCPENDDDADSEDVEAVMSNFSQLGIASGGANSAPKNTTPPQPRSGLTIQAQGAVNTGAIRKRVRQQEPPNATTSTENDMSIHETQNVYNATVNLLNETRQMHEAWRAERQNDNARITQALSGVDELRHTYVTTMRLLNNASSQAPPNPYITQPTSNRRANQRSYANQRADYQQPNFEFPPPPPANVGGVERNDGQANLLLDENFENQLHPQLLPALAVELLRNRKVDELPHFNGKDLHLWVKFEATYQYQVRAGVTRDKRLSNLSAALSGEAYDMVADHLIFREDPDVIIDELSAYYGDHDLILEKLTSEIIMAKPPRDQPKQLLINFAILVKRLVTNIRYFRRTEQLSSVYVERHIVRKLRDEHQDQWCMMKRRNPNANLANLSEFLMLRARDYSARTLTMPLNTTRRVPPNRPSVNFHEFINDVSFVENQIDDTVTTPNEEENYYCGNIRSGNNQVQNRRPNIKCFDCGEPHCMVQCRHFLNRTISQRLQLAIKRRICTSCLTSVDHTFDRCDRRRECAYDGCKLHHHWLLHEFKEPESSTNLTNITQTHNVDNEGASQTSINSIVACCKDKAQYGIVPLWLKDGNGKDKLVYAMLDLGAGVSLIKKDLFDELNLDGYPAKLDIKWADDKTQVVEDSKRTCLQVSVPGKKDRIMLNGVYTFSGLDLPVQSQSNSDVKQFHHLKDINLPEFQNVKPQILIGLPHAQLCAGKKLRQGEAGEPVANKTALGWVLYGTWQQKSRQYQSKAAVQIIDPLTDHKGCKKCDSYLHNTLHHYMSIDSFGIKCSDALLSGEEKQVQKIIRQTLKYDPVKQRYSVGLFWKNNDVKLPNSKQMALNRLIATEKSLVKRNLLEWTNTRMTELITKGYVREASSNDLNFNWPRVWYLPMFVVVNENKQPPKPRLVIDGAAEVGGKSLNSFLLTGPDLLAPMIGVLIQMRERQFVVAGDVKEMFHQIEIIPEDQQCQRVLWRNGDTTIEPKVYIWQVMTFGLTSSPATSQLVKNYHADLWRNKNEAAAEAAKNNVFVDDYVKSHDTLSETVDVTNASIELFKSMGLSLINFQSNSPKVLTQLPTSHVQSDVVDLDYEYQPNFTTKILGMKWLPVEDIFVYKPNSESLSTEIGQLQKATTKRKLLRIIMKIFDPLGLVAHILVQGKIILQRIWRDGVSWDETIGSQHLESLQHWANVLLTELPELKIQRWYAPVIPEMSRVELHIFSDASEEAMAAVAYLTFITNSKTFVSLVMAKTKVMPIRTLSIPRAELTAAVMGVRLAETVSKLLSFKTEEITFWTDSLCVLSQINSDNKLQQFFATRVNEILDKSTRKQWRHVPGKDNPADYGTKWHNDSTQPDCIWFKGAKFLLSDEKLWPPKPATLKEEATLISVVVPNFIANGLLKEISARYLNNWRRLRRIVAFRIRFLKIRILKLQPEQSFLTTQELQFAEEIIISFIQSEAFPEEYALLQDGQEVAQTSKLYQFTPFMASNGVIRMSSRLQNMDLSYSMKNPAILPNKHPLIDTLIQHLHDRNHHQNEAMILEAVREKGWLIHGREAVRRISRKCNTCKILRATPVQPRMGDLPLCRTDNKAYPFEHCGVDCFSQLYVTVGRARVPRYGLIFVCMTTRAIHLEPLEDMSSKACLSGIQIFASIYGPPKHFYSDNGTNFVGLSRIFNNIVSHLAPDLADKIGVTWHFNPPYTPHFGGAWERMIQSTKKMLQFFEYEQRISTDYDLRNLLAQISSRINDRPLTPLPVAPNEELPLSPKNFLRINVEHSIIQEEGDHVHRLNVNEIHRAADRLFKRWTRDYLPVITKRSKWFKDTRVLQVNDVVLLVDFSRPKIYWRRGIVVKIFPGRDGRPRVADVRIQIGDERQVKRTAVVNLARLDIQSAPTEADGGEDVGA